MIGEARSRRGQRLAPETREAVTAAMLAGLDDTTIAASLPVSRPTVAKLRRAAGLPPIASRWGERDHVARGPAAERRALEPRFRDLYDAGLSDRAAAAQLGCNHQLVRAWRLANRLPSVGVGGRPRIHQAGDMLGASIATGGRPRIAPARMVRRKPRPRRLRFTAPAISPMRDPLYAAAVAAVRSVSPHPEAFEDMVSELIVKVLSGEVGAADAEAARRLKRGRTQFGRGAISLSSPLFDDGDATLIERLAWTPEGAVLLDRRGLPL